MAKQFGSLLLKYRNAARLSQLELARRIGRVPSEISRWENAKREPPDRDMVICLATAIGVSAKDTDRLLIAAGYYPKGGNAELDRGHLLFRGLENLLSLDLPPEEKTLIEEHVDAVVNGWMSYAHIVNDAKNSEELLTKRNSYIHQLESVSRQYALSRLPNLYHLGKLSAQQNMFQEALTWFDRGLRAADEANNTNWKAELYVQKGNSYRALSQREPAIDCYEDAEDIFNQRPEGRLGVARCHRKQASIALYLGMDSRSAILKTEELLRSARVELEDLIEADEASDERLRAKRELFGTLCYLGWAYSIMGLGTQGLESRKAALELATELNDDHYLSIANRLLGDDLENSGDFEKAESRYREALRHCERIKFQWKKLRERGKVLKGLGNTMLQMGRLDECRNQINESLRLLNDIGDLLSLGWAFNVLARLNRREGSLSAARDAHERAKAIFDSVGNKYYACITQLDIAEVLFEQGELDPALRLARDVLRDAESLGSDRLLLRSLEAVAFYTLYDSTDFESVRPLYERFCRKSLDTNFIGAFSRILKERTIRLKQTGRKRLVQDYASHLLAHCPAVTSDSSASCAELVEILISCVRPNGALAATEKARSDADEYIQREVALS